MNNHKVIIGTDVVELKDNQLIGVGGQAEVYKYKNLALKIFLKDDVMTLDFRNKLTGLMQELRGVNSVIAPIDFILSKAINNKTLGYTMNFLDKGTILVSYFLNDFWKRNNITYDVINDIVKQMIEIILLCHSKDVVIIDPNEYNFIVKKDKVYMIDIDNCKYKNWCGSFIMPTLYDHHRKDFCKESDLFSLAVVLFQLYTGIHPYIGKLPGYGKNELKKRMIDNKSVFEPGVLLNSNVRPLNKIPLGLYEWFKCIFSTTKRPSPPKDINVSISSIGYIITQQPIIAAGTAQLYKIVIQLLYKLNKPIIKLYDYINLVVDEDYNVYELSSSGLINIGKIEDKNDEILLIDSKYYVFKILDKHLVYRSIKDSQYTEITLCNNFFISNDKQIFIEKEDKLSCLRIDIIKNKILFSYDHSWSIYSSMFTLYKNFGILKTRKVDILYLPKNDFFRCITIKELTEYRIISGIYKNDYIILMLQDKNGVLKKVEIHIKNDYDYDIWFGDIDNININTTITKNFVVSILEDGVLCLYSIINNKILKLNSSQCLLKNELYTIDDLVVYVDEDKIYSIKTVKS